jgi:superfamily II DNA or RNA helicase
MNLITVEVDSHLRIETTRLSEEVITMLVEAATIPNMKKIEAIEFGREEEAEDWPDEISLYSFFGEHLHLPRGMASIVLEGLEGLGYEIDLDDNRSTRTGFRIGKKIELRDYQRKIKNAVLEAEQGIVKAPTGSGKTVAILEIFRSIGGGRFIVIVNTKEIAQQWLDRIEQWLGESYPKGLIGDNEFEIASYGITVAIQASLWSQREQLEDGGFFNFFQGVCLDECHHATAETYRYIVDRFAARVRIGASATPEKTGDFTLAEAVLGPVICEVTDDEVADQIMKPEIHVVETKFGSAEKSRKHKRGHRGDPYEVILRKLTHNDERNHQIAGHLIDHHRDNANLVLSKRIDHLSNIWEALVDLGYPAEDIFTIVGQDSRRARKEVVERIDQGSCVVLSTLADEALDAPRLDRLHIAFPTANPDLVVQQVGRIRRRHPDKADAIVIDYRDFQVGSLNRQYMTRRHEVYDPSGWKVKKIKS